MPATVLPFLMFQGDGAEALEFYLSVFPGAAIEQIERYGEGGNAPAGSIKLARFRIGEQTVMCTDSPVKHAFTFTPSFSFFVECDSQDDVGRLGEILKQGGAELMPVGNYGFSTLFTWVSDRFGVSWQLNYA
ncbi:VOC family protein [Paraburkholderia unamae]|uniref:3-demethylubiquinone-9 3-methyltransferase (Glyoxalase superfamily) n=1 Tax=Paraburkholderia unamae TaxID=219649 RepID=A0ABX5KM32_9BURK|nr:VOC family protein [Paraburkholderia unamae]PVX78775.1 putative 3-demethylubiquinone-9 3-methyltransferase (glyoxalase superfamily) [Paraburkholderia unamae]CAG9244131.1 putative PhnB protein; DNA binding 3-demethylubiquinone-9 3-methyltransferase domain protein [Paraburkholderia unamae]